MKILKKGKFLNIQGNESIVIASLGVITANLPQGNDMAEVKICIANRGCQTCNVTKDSMVLICS
jgi:hypothetical protein